MQHMTWHDRVVAHPHSLYFPFHCSIGKRFVTTLAKLFEGLRERRWNVELALIYPAAILRKNPGSFKAAKIKQRIKQRMDLWDDRKIEALVTQIETAAIQSVGRGVRERDEETAERAFNTKVLNGGIRSAVRNLTNREGGSRPTRRHVLQDWLASLGALVVW